MKKRFLVAATMALSTPVFAGQWQPAGNGWKYQKDDGNYIINDWYLGNDGKWYYLDGNGKMATDTTINGYTVDSTGKLTGRMQGYQVEKAVEVVSLRKRGTIPAGK